MTAYYVMFKPFSFIIKKFKITFVTASNGQVDVQRNRGFAGSILERISMGECRDVALSTDRASAIAMWVLVWPAYRVVWIHEFCVLSSMVGIVKAAPDNSPGTQLELHLD